MTSLGDGAPSIQPAAPSGESAMTVGRVGGAAVAPGSSLGALESKKIVSCIIFKYLLRISILFYTMLEK